MHLDPRVLMCGTGLFHLPIFRSPLSACCNDGVTCELSRRCFSSLEMVHICHSIFHLWTYQCYTCSTESQFWKPILLCSERRSFFRTKPTKCKANTCLRTTAVKFLIKYKVAQLFRHMRNACERSIVPEMPLYLSVVVVNDSFFIKQLFVQAVLPNEILILPSCGKSEGVSG